VGVTETREDMVRQLRRLGIRDPQVLAAMTRIPRDAFLPDDRREAAYEDRALPIGEGQTISQPYVVARMTELLDLRPEHKVLEVGTGSGYQAAVLGELAREVVSVERHAPLADRSRRILAELGYQNVRVITGDASVGYPEEAPYDRVIVTAATPRIDPALAAQLTDDGLLVAPVGDEEMQELTVRDARGREERHGAVRFVPLRGRAGFST